MGVSSGKSRASGMVRGNEVGMENSESEGWLSVLEGLIMGVVTEVVHAFKVGGVTVVMIVDSATVGLGIWSVTEMDGMDVVIVSKILEDLGGGLVIVPKGMQGGEEV